MRGVYVLFIHLPYPMSLSIGGLGKVDFEAGFYAYVGSAMGGVEQRVGRHRSSEKRLHWHIDHFLLRSKVVDVVAAEAEKEKECELAGELSRHLKSVPGFGSSDCKCDSHLFYHPDFHRLMETVLTVFKGVGIRPVKVPST